MWHGAARTNFARYRDVEQLKRLCEEHGVKFTTGPDNFVMLEGSRSDDGDLPSMVETGEGEADFIEDLVAPLLEPGSVLVLMKSGADRMRYISGSASAWMVDGEGAVRWNALCLDDIYKQVSAEFGVPTQDIARAEYECLPASYQAAQAPVAMDACDEEAEGDGTAVPRG